MQILVILFFSILHKAVFLHDGSDELDIGSHIARAIFSNKMTGLISIKHLNLLMICCHLMDLQDLKEAKDIR